MKTEWTVCDPIEIEMEREGVVAHIHVVALAVDRDGRRMGVGTTILDLTANYHGEGRIAFPRRTDRQRPV
jgi:ribosomal protein S18 acetylase RimI-like enzyme